MPDESRLAARRADEIRRLSETLAREPGSLVFLSLGDALRRHGRLEEARRVAEQGIARHPELADGHALLGRVLADTGELEGAEACWHEVERLAPGHLDAARGLAFVRWRQGRVAEARALLEEARSRARDPASRRTIEAALGRLDGTPPTGVARLTPLAEVAVHEPAMGEADRGGAFAPASEAVAAALTSLLADAETFGETLAIGDCLGVLVECEEGLLAIGRERLPRGTRITRCLVADGVPVGRAIREIARREDGGLS